MTLYESNLDKIKREKKLKNPGNNVDLPTKEISCLIDNLPVTVFRSSSRLSGGMDYISTNVEKLTGYSKMDFMDQKLSWLDIVFPEDIAIIDKAVKKAKKSKSSYQIEYRIKKSDGSIALIQEKAHMVCDDAGNPTYIAGVFLDSTSEAKRREDSHGSVKENERTQLELFRSFVEKISEGEDIVTISGNFTGETKKTVDLINRSIGNIMGVLEEITTISKAGKEGHLSIRANDTKYPGGWGTLLRELNGTLDAIIGPLNVAAEYVERISRGDIPELITENYKGDFNEIKNNLNTCIAAVDNLIEDSLMLSKAGVAGRLDTRADATRHEGDFRNIVQGVNDTLDAVIGPMNVAAEYVERISRGDIPKHITDNYNGDFNEIKNNLNICIEAINKLVEDSLMLSEAAVDGRYETRADITRHEGNFRKIVSGFNDTLDSIVTPMNAAIEDSLMLSEAAVAGKLDVRADITKHEGNFRKIISGFNDTLDAVIGPLNVAAEYIERISRGDIPEPITDNYNGDFNEIKNNINTCIDGLQGLFECNNVLQRMAVNDHTKSVEGEYVGIYASMSEATNLVRTRLITITEIVNDIAIGNTSKLDMLKKIGKRSDQDQIMPAFIGAMENVQVLIDDVKILSKAAIEGKLDIRADTTKHKGEYKKVVEGVNDTLDAVIGPLNVAAEYVERISRGDIPQKITDNYNGDFNEIKNNLNNCIDGLQGLVECNNVLHRMAVNDLIKGVEGEYVGVYASMGEAANQVRERLLSVTRIVNNIAVGSTSELAGLKKIGKRSEQDILVPAFIEAMENIELLIEDTGILTRAGVEGKFDTRADVLKHRGEYRKIVQGINDTLDSIVVPMNAAIEDSLMLSKAAIEGKLDVRADIKRHEGNFRKIISGFNDTLDAVIGPLNVAAEYVERISRGDIPEPITDSYNGDFNEIKNNLNTCITAVNNLIEDSLMLSEAGIAGKLNIRADTSRHEGDFRKIVVGVNNTLDAFVGPIKSSKSVSMQVAEHSNEASKGADEVAKAAGNVAISSQKSSELTRELLFKIEGINKEIIDLSASNDKVADSSKGILSDANEIVRIGKDAQALGRDTNLKMGSVEKIAKESVDGINSLTEQIKQIDGIVQLINDITSQINLLSLNAAIEAARAGEHGRGFAVVAGEVKNLATKARNATETIENVVLSVQKDSKKTADAINTANIEIIDGVNSVNKTLDALNTIIKNATQVTKEIGDIAKAIENQANISMKVVQASEEGNAMTREVQREAEGLAAIAQETSASVQEIGAAIHEVTNLSNMLKSEIEKYVV